MVRFGRAVDEVPLLQRPLLALDDEERLAGEYEEVLLIGFPVVHRVRLARLEHDEIDAELGEERPRLLIGPAGEGQDRAAGMTVDPARVARVQDEPSGTGGDEARPGLLQLGPPGHRRGGGGGPPW